MPDAKLANTIARERVDGLTRSNGEPKWLKESRVSAWEKYLQTPMPTSRDDEWRKTEIDSLDLSQFVAVGPIKGGDPKAGQNPLFLSCTRVISESAGLFVEDYQEQNQTISLDAGLAAKGVIFCPLARRWKSIPRLSSAICRPKQPPILPPVWPRVWKDKIMSITAMTTNLL